MPEEINRMVTDSISDYFFVTESSGVDNLLREGKSEAAVFMVGHVMIDNLLHQVEKLKECDSSGFGVAELKSKHPDYFFVLSPLTHTDTGGRGASMKPISQIIFDAGQHNLVSKNDKGS